MESNKKVWVYFFQFQKTLEYLFSRAFLHTMHIFNFDSFEINLSDYTFLGDEYLFLK